MASNSRAAAQLNSARVLAASATLSLEPACSPICWLTSWLVGFCQTGVLCSNYLLCNDRTTADNWIFILFFFSSFFFFLDCVWCSSLYICWSAFSDIYLFFPLFCICMHTYFSFCVRSFSTPLHICSVCLLHKRVNSLGIGDAYELHSNKIKDQQHSVPISRARLSWASDKRVEERQSQCALKWKVLMLLLLSISILFDFYCILLSTARNCPCELRTP